MANYTATWQFYNAFFENAFKVMNFGTDTFKVKLLTSAYTFSASHSTVSDLTNEVSGNGYSEQTLSSVTLTQTAGVTKFDYAAWSVTASGGSIVARRFAIFDETPTSPADPLVGGGLLNDADADVTTTDGNTLTYDTAAGGQFTAQAA